VVMLLQVGMRSFSERSKRVLRAYGVFAYDRRRRTAERVGVPSDGEPSDSADARWLSISGDGRWIAFEAEAKGMVKDAAAGERDVCVVGFPEME